MNPLSWLAIPALVSAAAGGALALTSFRKAKGLSFRRTVPLALLATSIEQVANLFTILDSSHALWWRQVALIAELTLCNAIVYVGPSLIRPRNSSFEAAARWRAHAVLVLSAGLVLISWFHGTFRHTSGHDREMIGLLSLAQVLNVFIVLSAALGLTHLEVILRESRDPSRYQLKFILIGLGTLAAFQIYQASQLILLPIWSASQALVGALTALVGIGLIGFGLFRRLSPGSSTRVCLSHKAIYRSVTFTIVGAYLVVVGILGEWIRRAGESWGVDLSTVIVFGALAVLILGLLSRTFHSELRRIVSRAFFRSKYDYRAEWLETTRAFQHTTSVESILDQLLALLARTFGASRIAIWLFYESDQCFHQMRSINTETPPPPVPHSHALIQQLERAEEPLHLTRFDRTTDESLAVEVRSVLSSTQAHIVVPIRSAGRLLGFVTLNENPHGEGYRIDDHDLLHGIAHHVGVLLAHARLAEERTAAAELEALHHFSAFCLHDIKNLAARLSLVAQNAATHGHNPAFQQSAMRTVTSTIEKMTELISKLSRKASRQMTLQETDVEELVTTLVKSIPGDTSVVVRAKIHGIKVLADREQLQQVLLNLILNAHQASENHAPIQIDLEPTEDRFTIIVRDAGPGIPPEQLRTIFTPFRTTKAGGLGIGLYQCKRTMESFGGSVRIESIVGQGTSVFLEIPRTQCAKGDNAGPGRSAGTPNLTIQQYPEAI